MKRIYTRVELRWCDRGARYVTDWEGTEFSLVTPDAPVAMCCGADQSQKDLEAQQASFYTQATAQASQIFGESSSVFKDLMSTFAPTIAAGPNQEGFSAAEKANLNSEAITQTGQAYKNARQAVGETQSAQGGGNSQTSGGATVGTDLALASGAANQTSAELGQITQADYATGLQNYNAATQGLAAATGTYGASTGAVSAATGAGTAAATTANEISTQNNSWVQAATGALGSVAGTVMTGGMSNLAEGVGFLGQNAPAPGTKAP